jgi:hypothetical protein
LVISQIISIIIEGRLFRVASDFNAETLRISWQSVKLTLKLSRRIGGIWIARPALASRFTHMHGVYAPIGSNDRVQRRGDICSYRGARSCDVTAKY